MASAIWPPPMNATLLVIVGLDIPRSKHTRTHPEQCDPLFYYTVLDGSAPLPTPVLSPLLRVRQAY